MRQCVDDALPKRALMLAAPRTRRECRASIEEDALEPPHATQHRNQLARVRQLQVACLVFEGEPPRAVTRLDPVPEEHEDARTDLAHDRLDVVRELGGGSHLTQPARDAVLQLRHLSE